jgi:hypothetical protein
MSFMNSVAIIGAKYLMGVLALNVGLAMAFAFPMVLFFIAGILAGMVAKRAKASETLASAYPTTGAMSITED